MLVLFVIVAVKQTIIVNSYADVGNMIYDFEKIKKNIRRLKLTICYYTIDNDLWSFFTNCYNDSV